MRKYFGTDGIRGVANTYPLTPDMLIKIAQAAGLELSRGDHRHTVIIGKDTRLSGYMIESALAAGFISVGMDVVYLGPLPTPAVSMLTRSLRADLGVMISASHNPAADNGLKFFGPDGFKLIDQEEKAIEKRTECLDNRSLVCSLKLGHAQRLDDAQGRYIEYVKNTFPKRMCLDGLKIVIDCANGAAYDIAPRILWELGAEVYPIGDNPNGENINHECGATAPDAMRAAIIHHKADVGIALDGDADRVIIADESGQIIDGDAILALLTSSWKEKKMLSKNWVVGTTMSNLGLERFLNDIGIELLRTDVGDRYVVEAMRHKNINIGGEQSGHIILGDYVNTGDGLITALQFLAIMVEKGLPASVIGTPFLRVPQILKSIGVRDPEEVLQSSCVQDIIQAKHEELAKKGRIIVRKSGTEPLIRVMVEGDSKEEISRIADQVLSVIAKRDAAA